MRYGSPIHLVDAESPDTGWPLLRALEALHEPVIILGSHTSAHRARRSAPNLRVLGVASAPVWSDRSGALSLHRLTIELGLARSTTLAWSERAFRIGSHRLCPALQTVLVPDRLRIIPAQPQMSMAGSHPAHDVDQNTHRLVALGGPSGSVDAFAYAYLSGVLSLSGIPVVPIVPSSASHLDRAHRFIERHDHAWRLIVTDIQLPDLLPIADLAAYLPPARSGDEAIAALPSLVSELHLLSAYQLPAVLHTEEPTSGVLENLREANPLLHTLPVGRPGLETVRLVQAALQAPKRPCRFDRSAFDAWAHEVHAIADKIIEPVGI